MQRGGLSTIAFLAISCQFVGTMLPCLSDIADFPWRTSGADY